MATVYTIGGHGFYQLNEIIMFGLFKRKKNEHVSETLSLDSKEGRDSLYANLYFQVQEDPTKMCCLHIFRDGKEHYHVANGLNSEEIAKELFIAMNRSEIIRDAVIGAYNMNFKTDEEQDDIKGKSHSIKSLNGHLDGMSCYFSKDGDSLLLGKRTYHAEYAKSLAEFLLTLRDAQKPLTLFAVSLLDKNNVLCLSEGNVDDIADSLSIASAYNGVVDHIIKKSI